jgi:hypothetical protein
MSGLTLSGFVLSWAIFGPTLHSIVLFCGWKINVGHSSSLVMVEFTLVVLHYNISLFCNRWTLQYHGLLSNVYCSNKQGCTINVMGKFI